VAHVGVHSALGQEQARCDLLVGQALGYEASYLCLPGTQRAPTARIVHGQVGVGRFAQRQFDGRGAGQLASGSETGLESRATTFAAVNDLGVPR
jgi:hypothetical protein